MAEVPSVANYIPLEEYIDTSKVDEKKSQYYLVSHIYPTSEDMVSFFVIIRLPAIELNHL